MTQNAPVATGLIKQVRYASEGNTWAVMAAQNAADAKLLRRVASDISLQKATYRSNEIQPDRQVHDFRHGVRRVQGTLRGELSPLTWEAIFAQVLAGTFSTGGSTGAGPSITTNAAVLNTSPATLVRATGSWVTDGFKIGDVVRISGSAATANNARNLRVTGITQTTNPNDTLELGPKPTTAFPSLGNEVLVAHGAETTLAVAAVGKKLVTPVAGSAVDASFTIEHWFPDVGHSEVFVGCRASRTQISLPPSGLSTVAFDFMGKDVSIDPATAGNPWFTSPAGVTTSGITASVNGIMRVDGVDYAIVTGMNFTINPNYTVEAVVGSNTTPYLFPGIQDVTGQFTALFLDEAIPTAFLNESEIDMQVYLTLNNNVNADFLSFYFPRVKLTSGNKDDKPGAIVGTYGFQALNNINFGTNNADETTIVIQDSLAS